MELRNCDFNRKGEIVCEEIQLSLGVDKESNSPILKQDDLNINSGIRQKSELPNIDKKVV